MQRRSLPLALRAAVSALCALAAACQAPEPAPFGDLTLPAASEHHLVLADRAAKSLIAFRLEDGEVTLRRDIPLSGTPDGSPIAIDGSDTVLVLEPDARALDRVDLGSGDVTPIALGAPFTRIVLTPDGKAALAFAPYGDSAEAFNNANEVALVDLASTQVARRQLASLGGAPLFVAFSPELDGPTGPRHYAFVASDEHLAIVNMAAPTMVERSVPLVSLTAGGQRTPTAISFGVQTNSVGAPSLWGIVTTAETTAVYALEVVPLPGAPTDFDVHLVQLAGMGPGGAATLANLAGTASDGVTKLVVLATNPSQGTLTLTDLDTANGVATTLATGLDRIALFDTADGTPSAIVWSSYGGGTLYTVDLEALAAGRDRVATTHAIQYPFTAVTRIDQTALFLTTPRNPADPVLVFDAETDRVTPFSHAGRFYEASIDPAAGRLHAIVSEPDGASWLVTIELATFHTEAAPIPGAGSHHYRVARGAHTIATFAIGASGYFDASSVVLWPADLPAATESLALGSFILEGVFQGGAR